MKWVSENTVLAIHDEQLAEHGGMPGLRDLALVQSALHRAQNLAAYGDNFTVHISLGYLLMEASSSIITAVKLSAANTLSTGAKLDAPVWH